MRKLDLLTTLSNLKSETPGAGAPQHFIAPGFALNAELPGVSNLVAFLELERFDHSGGKADSVEDLLGVC